MATPQVTYQFVDEPETTYRFVEEAEAPKPMTAREQQKARFDEVMGRGAWGSGLPKVMYELGGKVTDVTGSPALGAAVSILPDIVQTILGGNIAGAVTKPATDAGARVLMRSALKPTLTEVKKGRAAPAIETMLRGGKAGMFSRPGFNPTPTGVEKMKLAVSELGDDVSRKIAGSGATVSARDVADYVPDAYKKFASGPQWKSAMDDLGKVQQEFIEHPMVSGARDIPIQTAQELKSGYQKAIGDKGYGELRTAATEGEKQIARGLRELIGKARPDVLEPLEKESAIIRALKLAERRAAMDANKNPIGLGWLGQPWMIPFWMWDRSPAAKAATARALATGNYPALGGAAAAALYQGSNVEERSSDLPKLSGRR